MTSRFGISRTAFVSATLAGALLFLPLTAMAASGNSAAGAQSPNVTMQNVEGRLSNSHFRNVKVTVNKEGIAKLTGSVNLYFYKKKAAKKALHTKGVTAVKNDIQVGGPNISDRKLEKKLGTALAYNRVGFGNVFDAISVSVHNGVVTLGGHAHDYPNRNAAIAMVETTPGVKGVINHIKVDPPSIMDWRIRHEVAEAVYGYPTLNKYALNPAKPIRISVQNGHVELYGTVDNKADKRMAYIQADSVPGVFSVKNHLHVQGQAQGPKGRG